MKTKHILCFVLFLLTLGEYCSAADVKVTPMSDQESAYFMQNLERIVIFTDASSNFKMAFYSENDAVVAEKEVQSPTKITFETQEESIHELAADNSSISFYPNPSTDYIHIIGLQEPTEIHLYDLKGQVVCTSMSADINVASLTAGTYVLRVGNQCFKVIIR